LAWTAINLGSGVDYKMSTSEIKWLNVDYADCKCDLKHDITIFPYPIESETADVIELNAVLEHIPVKLQEGVINECWRILKPGGQLIIRVPHFTGAIAWNELEHIKPYGAHTFDGFVKNKNPHSMNDYYARKQFSSIKVRIVFGKHIQFWNYLVEWLVNLSGLTQDIYEQSFLRPPSEGCHVVMTK